MAFGDIRIGSGNGPVITQPSSRNESGYFVEGKAGTPHGPFVTWEEAKAESERVQAQWQQEQAMFRSGGFGR